MPAIDTVGFFATEGAAAAFPTALAAVPGDSLSIRNFPNGQTAAMSALIYDAGGSERIRVVSPNLHDNQTGLTFEPLEKPAQFLLPQESAVNLVANDTLSLYGGIAAAGTITGAMQIYYSQLPGIQARLHSWGDISGNVRYFKSVEVDLGAIAVGAWTDTLITTTENQLHANKDYAVLGYQCSEAVDVVGVKGSATGNLRVCGPGASSTLDITEYFVFMSEMQKTPYIPVFNS
ncbi:MAG: hypothetical protein ACRDTV_25220, partial [Mycobacterium sp.]